VTLFARGGRQARDSAGDTSVAGPDSPEPDNLWPWPVAGQWPGHLLVKHNILEAQW